MKRYNVIVNGLDLAALLWRRDGSAEEQRDG